MLSEVDIILYIMYNGMVNNMVLKMSAHEFDEDGHWSPGGGEQFCLLGIDLDIPEWITHSGEEEVESIMFKTFLRTGDCMNCGERSSKETIVFGTNQYRMLVLYCCDKVVWTREEFIKEHREERGWKDNSRME